jgi:hypothetical protein
MSSTIHTAPSPDDPAAPVEAGHSQFSASAPSFSVRSAPAAPTAGSSLSASSPITFASAGAASADSTAVVAGAGSVDASAASAVPAEFPEPTGAQAWLDYDETEDYREHSKWSLVRSRPFKHKLKWFAYKVADGTAPTRSSYFSFAPTFTLHALTSRLPRVFFVSFSRC